MLGEPEDLVQQEPRTGEVAQATAGFELSFRQPRSWSKENGVPL